MTTADLGRYYRHRNSIAQSSVAAAESRVAATVSGTADGLGLTPFLKVNESRLLSEHPFSRRSDAPAPIDGYGAEPGAGPSGGGAHNGKDRWESCRRQRRVAGQQFDGLEGRADLTRRWGR